MIQHFNVNGITSLLIRETPGQPSTGYGLGDSEIKLSYMSDNIVVLSMDLKEKVKRTLAVLKARDTTTGSALKMNLCRLFSSRSVASTEMKFPAAVSGWQPANGSWKEPEEVSGRTPSQAKVRRFVSYSRNPEGPF